MRKTWLTIGWITIVLSVSLVWAQALSFTRVPGDFEAAAGAFDVVVADLNNDGNLDTAVAANFAEDVVSVLLGNGDGTLDANVDYEVGLGPVSIKAAFINSDAFLDLITADESGDTVSVLLNDGDGTFGEAVITETGVSPEDLAVGDFDDDDITDVATADNIDDTVTVQFGVGDGTFRDSQTIVVGSEPLGIAAADLDEDDDLDLVVVNSTGGFEESGTLMVLEGLGGGVFDPLPEINSASFVFPVAIEVGDLNKDGHADVVVVNDEGDNISALLGNGNLTFRGANSAAVNSFPEALALADLSGDGILDVATTSVFDDNVAVLTGVGDGTFTAAELFDVGVGPHGVDTGNLNNSGGIDIATANQDDSTVSVLLNNGAPGPTPTPGTGCVGDCDGNGSVTVDEIVTMVNIALGLADVSSCEAGDPSGDGNVTVDEILTAVNNALNGCGQ